MDEIREQRAPEGADFTMLRARIRELLAEGVSALDESLARELFAGVLPLGRAISCSSAEEAVRAAEELGYPVVVKGLSPDLLHKSEHGLVVTDCADAEAVRSASDKVRGVLAARDGNAGVVSVQSQLSGAELAVGIRQDELGPVCMVATGGTLIELLADRALGMAPLDEERAAAMVASLKMSPLLDGYRDRAPADTAALVDLIVEVSKLAAEVPEIRELDLNPVFVGPRSCGIADARAVLGDALPGSAIAERPSRAALGALFEPDSIAVIGGSSDERKPGGLLLKYLRKHGYSGRLVAVNPKPVDLPGLETFPTISAVPGPVDLACVAVSGRLVEGVVRECVEAEVPAGIIFSAGFAEEGEEGKRAQDAVVAAAGGRFRFVGPNSIGIASPGAKMFATFGMALEAETIAAGNVGLISQSGAIASSLISRASEFNLAFSHWISGGNEADLGVASFIAYLVDDPSTDVICLFLEAVREPRAFECAALRALGASKPIIALKTGRSEAGRAAAASHTGAMTGSHAAYEAFLEDVGVLQVDSLPGLFCAAQGLAGAGPAAGSRVGIVSMSGGACSVLADACSDAGLEVPDLPQEVQRELVEILPSFGGTRNPIDVTAEGIRNPELVHQTLEILRASGAVDIVLVQLSTNADPAARVMAEDLVGARENPGVPFLVGRLGSPSLAPRAIETYASGGLHVFSWPDDLVRAARASVDYGRLLARRRETESDLSQNTGELAAESPIH